jgi:outer membrane lipoprotein carrier protein
VIKKAFFLGLLCCASIAFADAGAVHLNQLLQNFETLQADFTTHTVSNHGPITDTTGSLIIEKPNQFNYNVKSPNKELFISNGQQVWDVEPDLQQVVISPLSHNLSTTPLLLLSGSTTDLNTLFTVSEVDAQDYILTPKDKNAMIKQIKLSFDEDGTLATLEITNTLGQISTMVFSNVLLNQPVPKHAFSFTPPAGMDIMS